VRYLRLYKAFVANCLSRAMEFRAQFFAGIIAYMIWSAVSLLFIEVVFAQTAIAGWTRDEMWVLYGTALVLESICWGLIGPNMWRFSGMVRDGGLDLALCRPVNTQFLVSARYIDPNGVLNALPGFGLLIFGLNRLNHWPAVADWLLWALMLGCGILMAYCVWFFIVIFSIWTVKLESAAVIFDPMMQLARFPVDIYPRSWHVWLTFFLPVAFLTTFPTNALLGRGQSWLLPAAVGVAAIMVFLISRFFNFALRFYSSASS
jgi:ABC-2 type transport system permease protein